MDSTSAGITRWRFAAGIAVIATFGWFSVAKGTRVPLLGLVDLGFHELGHLLTQPFPDVVTAAMGSITQVAVPVGLAVYFLAFRGDRLGGSICLGWAGASAQDAAAYIADAPTQDLMLLGGEHDWAFVLGPEHLDMLDRAAAIATWVKWLGFMLLLAGLAICALEVAFPARAPTVKERQEEVGAWP